MTQLVEDERGYGGEDAEKGKLFEVPRVAIVIDESDPSVVKLAFSGSIELDRGNAEQVEFYNGLRAGQEVEVVVTAHVAGAKKTHRRDSDGYVDAVVETKSVVVSDVYVGKPEE
jgi:hypothetical protein